MAHNSFNSLALIAIRWNFGAFIKLGWLSPRELLCGGMSTPIHFLLVSASPAPGSVRGPSQERRSRWACPDPLATHARQTHLQPKSNQREALMKAIFSPSCFVTLHFVEPHLMDDFLKTQSSG